MFDLKNYFKKSSDIILTLSEHEKEINHICEEIIKASKNNKKILVAGNGGSCSDAEHFAGELQCTYKNRNRKPIAHSIGVLNSIEPPHIVAIQENILIPVGTAIIIVAAKK